MLSLFEVGSRLGAETHPYDWRNRLATTTGPASIIYSYDENDNRVRMIIGSDITHFPSPYYMGFR
jgi:hypothetical protein